MNQINNNAVVHIIPNGDLSRGGLAYASIRLAHEQARSGLNTYIFELDPFRRKGASWWCDDVNYIDYGKNDGYLKRFLKLCKFLETHSPLIHFHGVWSPHYLVYFFLVLFTKSRFIVSPHGSFESGALQQKFFKKFLARKLYLNRILSRSTAFWACSEKESASLIREFPSVPVDVVPIGVDMPVMNFLVNHRKHFNQPKIILVISRFNPGKGLLNLINAWNLIQHEGWRIILAGPDENNYQHKIKRELANLSLTQYFSLPGYVDSLERDSLYRCADIFVLPSLSENFGIVVIEAMSYGVPVLTTNETPWSYVGLERGCLCVDTDPQALSQGLKKLIDLSVYENENIRIAARDFVQKNFSWHRVIEISTSLLKKYY